MSGITRATNTADEDPFAWATAVLEPAVRDDYDPVLGEAAQSILADALNTLRSAVADDMDTTLTDAVRYMVEGLMFEDLAATVDLIETIRRGLGVASAYVAREMGRADTTLPSAREGHLPDGRGYTVRRGNNRRAWDHDQWKSDVRKAVLKDTPGSLVNPDSGELVQLYPLLEQVQGVHGSGAPKVTALKQLGLDAKDYCETVPGTFGIQFTNVDPTTKPTVDPHP